MDLEKNNFMKKDLILITAFCNTEGKLKTIRKLVSNLRELGSENFDILISSHSILPQDIVSQADYFFYDSKNILLEDFDLRSCAWFNPIQADNDKAIQSILVGQASTHLAVWRLLILGNTIAKTYGYNKVHHVEYDTEVEHVEELLENSKLLDTYDVVTYSIADQRSNYGLLLGSFQSYRLDTLSDQLTKYDEEAILNTVRYSLVKSSEGIYKNVLHTNKKYLEKDVIGYKLNGMKFALSKTSTENIPEKIAWCIPYYDTKSNTLQFFIWNAEKIPNLNIKLIYNNSKVYTINDVAPDTWRIIELGNYDTSEELIVLVDNKIRNIFDFNKIRDIFKLHSYR